MVRSTPKNVDRRVELDSFFGGDSDPAVKQLLVNMDEKQSFIIQDLDDNHLLIKADEEDRVRRELDAEVRVWTRTFATMISLKTLYTAGKEHV